MKIAVFSDLHLPSSDDGREKFFSGLLSRLDQIEGVEQFWLLGDIFDLLIGDFVFWDARHPEFWSAIEQLKKNNRRIVWLEGNHDFHFNKLGTRHGVEVLDAEIAETIGGKRIFLAHGDLVNPNEKAYLRWRKVTRNALFRKAISAAPEALAQKTLLPFAEGQSQKSRTRNNVWVESAELRSLYRTYASQKWSEGFDGVFLGHCHIAENVSDGSHFYFNAGAPKNQSVAYAVWDSTLPQPEHREEKVLL